MKKLEIGQTVTVQRVFETTLGPVTKKKVTGEMPSPHSASGEERPYYKLARLDGWFVLKYRSAHRFDSGKPYFARVFFGARHPEHNPALKYLEYSIMDEVTS